MNRIVLIIVGIVFFVTIILHLLKIIYLIFRPSSWEKYKAISNLHPSRYLLTLYYLITIAFLIMVYLKRYSGDY